MRKLVKFMKYVRPDEPEEYCNREELREIWINPESVSSIDNVISEYYGSGGFLKLEFDIVTVISMNNGQIVKVEGSMEEVIGKLKGE